VARRSPLLRVAQRRHGRNDDRKKAPLPTEAEWERARAAVVSTHFTLGRRASAVPAQLRRALRQSLECRPRAGRPRRTEPIRPLQHVRQRPRVVQRLFAPDYYAVSPERNPAVLHPASAALSRRLLASPHQNVSLRRRSSIPQNSIRRLRLPRSLRRHSGVNVRATR